MKKTNKLSLTLAIALLSSTVYAAPYVSGEVGYFGYGNNNPFKNMFDNRHSDAIGATGRLSAGYLWDVADCIKLGVEAGFSGNQNVDLKVDGTKIAKYKRFGVDALAVADYSVTPEFDVFAKAGATYVHQRITSDLDAVDFTGSSSHVVPKAVIGVGYNVSENVNLNMSLNHEFQKRSSHDSFGSFAPGATSLLAGIKYNFC